MISICVVVDVLQGPCFEPFLRSVIAMSSGLVSHVYVGCIDDTGTGKMDCTEKINGVTVNLFDVHVPQRVHWISYKHSIGLHKCMERVKTKYLMISDCDILFECPGYDKFYIDLLETNDLRIAGLEMYKIAAWRNFVNAYGSFPSIHNCLVRTDELPKPEMFAGKLFYTEHSLLARQPRGEQIHENYYLVAGCIHEFQGMFPAPCQCYDTGCNLLIWNEITKGKWVSFVPGWKRIVFDRFQANKPGIVIPPHQGEHLLYHQGGLFDGSDLNAFKGEFKYLCKKYPQVNGTEVAVGSLRYPGKVVG